MIYIRICDDIATAKKIERLAEFAFKKAGVACKCEIYGCGMEFLEVKERNEDELIFLNVELPDMSGFEVAGYLKDSGRNQRLVFITDYDQAVFPSLEYFPFHVLRKSQLTEEVVGKVVEQFLKQFLRQSEEKTKVFSYSFKNQIYSVPLKAISCVSCWQHKIALEFADGTKQCFRGTIAECERQLLADCFFKANSGTIVNLEYCQSFDGESFVLQSGEKILVSRDRRKAAKQSFMKRWQKHR